MTEEERRRQEFAKRLKEEEMAKFRSNTAAKMDEAVGESTGVVDRIIKGLTQKSRLYRMNGSK